jgi:hypothetical protein
MLLIPVSMLQDISEFKVEAAIIKICASRYRIYEYLEFRQISSWCEKDYVDIG